MSTYHQRKTPVKLYSATKWSVVSDGYNKPTGIMLFDSAKKAEVYLAKILAKGNRAYILPPTK